MGGASMVDVLAFSPHPDDAEIGCGGLLLLSAQQGLRTAIVDLSEGERATRGTPQVRQREKALAAQRLSVSQRIGLGFADTRIGTETSHEAAVVACLRQLRPRLVLAPTGQDRHPDHWAASRLIDRAAFFAGVPAVGTGPPHRIQRLLHYSVHQPVVPSLVFDVTQIWPDYLHAVTAYRSQFFGEAPDTALSDGGFLDVLQARGRYYGAMIGTRFGEAYVSPVPLFVDSVRSLLRAADFRRGYDSFR